MELVDLLTLDEVVGASAGFVYSTQPRRAQGQNGIDYFVKGPDQPVVFPELTRCLLAAAAGIPVADVDICQLDGMKEAGSRSIADIGRNVKPWLHPARAANFAALYSTIVVDAWLVNEDRNLGNVLAMSRGKGTVDLVMIDFEKSVALRPNPIVTSPTIPPQKHWPRGELGDLLTASRPFHPPTDPLKPIRPLAEKTTEIDRIVAQVTELLGPVAWSENSVLALKSRGSKIDAIAEEVWEAA